MVKPKYSFLTPEQVDHWMEHGYIVLHGAIKPEYIKLYTADLWVRLGYDPNDKSTWTEDRMHMPWHHSEPASVVAPDAWRAMCDLVGGADRLDPLCTEWKDNLILNLGNESLTEDSCPKDPHDIEGWHVDGDWFRHYLDSPEQALLMIALFSDVRAGGGATWIAPDGIGPIANVLLQHPEGTVSPQYDGGFFWRSVIPQCKEFVELTGKAGDVVLLHPLMLHSASKNWRRDVRLITNPPAILKEPFDFNREDTEEFSLVELKTLKELGRDRVEYQITGRRERIVSPRVGKTDGLLQQEMVRLRKHSEATGKPLDSLRVNKDVETIPW
ncbi:hypothetical protein CALVIDRAFT_513959 [Calocera viscosa TUFC12733]|uniref:Phytanoyl-CoA dioxygenase n=1 Tax=Calocera viscosa (strain TUFC12733) TaxID=1330018 RepID=A0A167MW46_CALVF|nr:hypothetical protein CALVIDRAFT_513959 [Calocera viscosa TUFC12733]